MTADLRTEHRQDQVRESVDHRRMPVESRRAVHHAEHPRPARDAIEIAKLALQAAEDRQADLARDLVALARASRRRRPCRTVRPATHPAFCGPWPETITRSPRTLTHGNGNAMPPGTCIGGGRVRPSSFSLDSAFDIAGPLHQRARRDRLHQREHLLSSLQMQASRGIGGQQGQQRSAAEIELQQAAAVGPLGEGGQAAGQ